jgi:hypothetical protein
MTDRHGVRWMFEATALGAGCESMIEPFERLEGHRVRR